MNCTQLGKNIAHYRKQAGLTQEDLGQILFVSGQAVSRWERGGAPDPELLPRLADALNVSLDQLFGHTSAQSSDVLSVLTQNLMRTPAEKRLERAYQIAWHMMKTVASSYGEPGYSSFRVMSANEELDRRGAEVPTQVPVNNYFDFDYGLLQSCVARDFHYVLVMPEPERGFSSIMKQSAAYQRLFAFLAQDHCLDLLVLAHSIPEERNFTAAFAAEALKIPVETASQILEQMCDLYMLLRARVRSVDGILNIYYRHDETLLVPLLYFAGEMMHNGEEVYYALGKRKEPLFKAPLGTDSLSPQWLPEQDSDDTTPLCSEFHEIVR